MPASILYDFVWDRLKQALITIVYFYKKVSVEGVEATPYLNVCWSRVKHVGPRTKSFGVCMKIELQKSFDFSIQIQKMPVRKPACDIKRDKRQVYTSLWIANTCTAFCVETYSSLRDTRQS